MYTCLQGKSPKSNAYANRNQYESGSTQQKQEKTWFLRNIKCVALQLSKSLQCVMSVLPAWVSKINFHNIYHTLSSGNPYANWLFQRLGDIKYLSLRKNSIEHVTVSFFQVQKIHLPFRSHRSCFGAVYVESTLQKCYGMLIFFYSFVEVIKPKKAWRKSVQVKCNVSVMNKLAVDSALHQVGNLCWHLEIR